MALDELRASVPVPYKHHIAVVCARGNEQLAVVREVEAAHAPLVADAPQFRKGARVVAQILNFLDFVLVKRRAACDAAEDVAPLLERIARAADVFERLEELAVKNGYAVGGSGGTSAGDRRANVVPGARFANARRVLERVRVDEKDPDSIRVAAMHAHFNCMGT